MLHGIDAPQVAAQLDIKLLNAKLFLYTNTCTYLHVILPVVDNLGGELKSRSQCRHEYAKLGESIWWWWYDDDGPPQ